MPDTATVFFLSGLERVHTQGRAAAVRGSQRHHVRCGSVVGKGVGVAGTPSGVDEGYAAGEHTLGF